jgi:hypothetical protein
MDYAVTQCAIRRGAQATLVGEHWAVDPEAIVRGPNNEIVPHFQEPSGAVDSVGVGHSYVEPPLAGRYSIRTGNTDARVAAMRVAMLDRAEHVIQPNEQLDSRGADRRPAALTKVGISREIALLALILGALELAFRAVKRARGARPLPSAVS